MSDRWLFLLLTQAWQLTLVIVVVAILSRRIARQRPHLAVALWLIVLAKSITPPVWSSPLGVFSWTILTSSPAPVEIAPLSSTWRPVAANVDLLSLDPLPEPPAELLSSPEESSESTAVVAAPPLSAIAFPDVERTPIELRRWSRAAALLAIWPSGAALTLLVICSRLLHLWCTLSRAGVGPDAELAGHVETLRKRLMLRRHVRVWVTPTDHGPAVLGLFRPWLLLPKTLVDSVSPDDLEPLLAHELLHIRRGDLWIGRWQALVQAAWWPHPLVWWSNRVLTRQLERCCDEEVLAELGCEPGRYARGLLKALELKHRLRPVPAAPGSPARRPHHGTDGANHAHGTRKSPPHPLVVLGRAGNGPAGRAAGSGVEARGGGAGAGVVWGGGEFGGGGDGDGGAGGGGRTQAGRFQSSRCHATRRRNWQRAAGRAGGCDSGLNQVDASHRSGTKCTA